MRNLLMIYEPLARKRYEQITELYHARLCPLHEMVVDELYPHAMLI
jgi:hypothetical protein